jgi:heme/copper-type cytochrome/quinol oxidase subunit 3
LEWLRDILSWVFLTSDAIMFGLLFATYADMLHSTAGGPGPAKLFDIKSAFIEIIALLSSSFTYGIGVARIEIRAQERAAAGMVRCDPCLSAFRRPGVFMTWHIRHFAAPRNVFGDATFSQ